MELRKFDGALFLFWILGAFLIASVVWLWEKKKEKGNYRWCSLIPAYYCAFRYTKRYHVRVVQHGPLLFLSK